MLNDMVAGGLGFEPRLTESESYSNLPKNWRNVSLSRVCGQELKETDTPKSGFIRHIIVTGNRPLSAKTGETPCGLSPYVCPLRIDNGTFVIVEPTTPVQPLSLLLGTISYRIISRVRSLGCKTVGRCGNLYKSKDTRRASPVLKSGTSNRERLIFGRKEPRPSGQSLPTVIQNLQCVVSLLKPSSNEPYLGQDGRKLLIAS